MGTLTFVLGGSASGKSDVALDLALAADAPLVYLATLEAPSVDGEMAARIARHREQRPADAMTIESPTLDLADVPDASALLVDSLTTHLAWAFGCDQETLLDGYATGGRAALTSAMAGVEALIAAAYARSGPTWVVSDELGMSVVPSTRMSRAFRDLVGDANRKVAAAADRALLVVAGRTLELT